MGLEGRRQPTTQKTIRWINPLVLGLAMTSLAWPGLAEGPIPESAEPHGGKTATSGSRLLLPRYEVDTNDTQGITTLFAVRNETGNSVELTINYYRTDGPQAPQHSEMVTLAGKAVKTVNIRSVPNLATDPDGFRRGFVVISAPGDAQLMGDFFQITSGDNFANGSRLLDTDPASNHNDLCNLFSMRFLNGGGFDSGTLFTIFLDLPLAPDGSSAVMDILAYDEAGNLLLAREAFADEVSFQVTADDLISPTVSADFGAIEFQFRDGSVGHVAAVLNASGRYSVGFEASCGDF